ncbi:MAG: hypothetical protein K0S20_604 [Patescibacteria group bacterium]|jgi:hypothetical protein|nr:hypothetical protein [Patescibacteria group bacterium]
MAQKILRVQANNRNQQRELNDLLESGWTIKSSSSMSQGYSAGSVCCLGCIFLPLALLAKKPDIIEYILEKND